MVNTKASISGTNASSDELRCGSILQRRKKEGFDRRPTLLMQATFAVKEVAAEVYGTSVSSLDAVGARAQGPD